VASWVIVAGAVLAPRFSMPTHWSRRTSAGARTREAGGRAGLSQRLKDDSGLDTELQPLFQDWDRGAGIAGQQERVAKVVERIRVGEAARRRGRQRSA
jgi:hypothetical protein